LAVRPPGVSAFPQNGMSLPLHPQHTSTPLTSFQTNVIMIPGDVLRYIDSTCMHRTESSTAENKSKPEFEPLYLN